MNFKHDFKSKMLREARFSFAEAALDLFHYQARHNQVYADYLKHLGIARDEVKELEQIPFLPIEFFKWQQVVTGSFVPEVTFLSSGTTLSTRSRHLVADKAFYLQNAVRIFEHFYGPLSGYCFIGMLPSYEEQGGSSLILMVEHFMRNSGQPGPYFFRQNNPGMYLAIDQARVANRKVVVWGVTYALLDLAEAANTAERACLREAIIMETGGMKGRRQEMIRAAVHEKLSQAFSTPLIHSEYGMTELLSQAYSVGEGFFRCPPVMSVLLRDINDPLDVGGSHTTGGINIIDLANVDSCAFIETKDIGRWHPNGSFEVLGRYDNADVRGCSLLLT